MAGFREFVTGEVLTAANVDDYLAKQAVMKFADSAARDTALGTAVGGDNALREGMVAYLDDTDEVLFYDGAAWGAVGLPLGTATPTDGQILAFGTATSTWNPTDGGKVLQAVVATDTSDRSTTSSSFVDANISVSITPKNASSTLYAFWTVITRSGNSNSATAANSRTELQITDASNNALEGAENVKVQGRQQGTVPTSVDSAPFIFGRVNASDTTTRTYKGRFRYSGSATGIVCNLLNSDSTGMLVVLEVGP